MAVNFYNGYIADTPATASDMVRVSVPNLTQMDRVVYGPLPWQPLTNSNGDTIWPTLGDKCLIADDDSVSGAQWIVRWTGTRIASHSGDLTSKANRGVGIANDLSPGRKLTVADFTTLLGVAAPIALYNLDYNGTNNDAIDSSGNGRTLTATTDAPSYSTGVTGVAQEAVFFFGHSAAGLFTADGNGGPFNMRTGTFGCWFKTHKQGVSQRLMCKGTNTAGSRSWMLSTDSATDGLKVIASTDGTNQALILGNTGVHDDRWHFGVGTFDGSVLRLYTDCNLDGIQKFSGDLAQGSFPFNIGSAGITAIAGTGNDATPMFGRIDEAFVHPEVLNEDQLRVLMAAKVPHGLGVVPAFVTTKVRRRRRGGPISATDFPTPPRRLYNFTGGAINDQGTDATTLTAVGTVTSVDGVDGALRDAKSFPGSGSNYFTFPTPSWMAGLNPKTIGVWFMTNGQGGAQMTILSNGSGGTDWRPFYIDAAGAPSLWDGVALSRGSQLGVVDGMPHLWVGTWDNNEPTGIKRKGYLDGRLIGSDSTMLNVTAGTFWISQLSTGAEAYKGLLDGLFACDYAMTAEQIATLFAVGSKAMSAAMFDNSIVEAADATNLYLLANYLDPQHLLDIRVAA